MLYKVTNGNTEAAVPVQNDPFTISKTEGWTKTISHLLKKSDDGTLYTYYIEEVQTDLPGYEVTYGTLDKDGTAHPGEEGTIVTLAPGTDSKLYVRNTSHPSYELPHTGGSGTDAFITWGALMTLIAAAGLTISKLRRKREGEQG